jgi:hypothetical protein
MNDSGLPQELEERAKALHREAFVFDAAVPTMGFFRDDSKVA